MTDLKKLIKILECCREDDCQHCLAYLTDDRPCDCATEPSIPVPVFIFEDVLKLLKEQAKEPVSSIIQTAMEIQINLEQEEEE